MGGQRYGVEIRAAVAGDAAELGRLLSQAGLAVAVSAERLEAARAQGAVLVATGYGGLSGVAAVHWWAVLQDARPVAALSALVVDGEVRRNGIGRLLVKAAAQAARAAGCEGMTLTAGVQAGAFCEAAGFVRQGAAWVRPLRRRGAAD